MNSSTILKRTLPLIIVILIIIGISVSCSVLNKNKEIPSISNQDELYFSITEGDRTYKLTNGEMYDKLKSSVGLSILLEKIDTDLLKSTLKPETTTSYWDLVSQEEINDAIEKAKFPEADYPNGRDGLSEDEVAKREQEFIDEMFTSFGLKTLAEIENYHRLTLAKKLYAKDELKKTITETDQKALEDDKLEPYFTEDEYTTYYNANYKNGYWTIIVPFNNAEEAAAILEQLGIEADPDKNNNWVYSSNKTPLTVAQVAKAFIDMYNTVYSKNVEGYPTETLTLKDGVQYTIEQETQKIVFNKTISDSNDELNRLYYSYQDIVDYQAEIQTFLNVSMSSYVADATELPTTKSWYTPKVKTYNGGKIYAYILKIGEEIAKSQNDVKNEIYNALLEAELTDTLIGKEMAQLRTLNNIKFFDVNLEDAYITSVKAYSEDYKAIKDEEKTLVASIAGKEYTTDNFFDLMDSRFGYVLVADEINYQRILNNPEFNKIYDYYLAEAPLKDKVLDKEKWEAIRERTVREKQNFVSGAYSNYGYEPTYGWENFIKDFYNVENESELIYYFLYSEVLSQFSNTLGDVSKLGEESELWKTYLKEMTEIKDEYFNVTGIHLLISVNDEKGNPIDPKEWNALQVQYAKELYESVWDYYETETGTSAEKLEAIANLFNEAPRFLANREQVVTDQPVLVNRDYVLTQPGYTIELSKYKTAGLSVKFEDLGSFTNGKMVKEFDEAVRSIWKANPSTTTHIPYGYTPGSSEYEYLVTEFGYHVYINTSTTDIAKWNYESDVNTKYVLPTLQMVKTYLADSDSEYLHDEEGNETTVPFTAEMKSSVTTYFVPVKNEIVDSYNTTINLYEQIQDLNIDFNSGNYTKEEFNRFLNLRIESYKKNLVYLAVEE